MLLLPIYFILGLLSTVYSAPFAAISNRGAPNLRARGTILVDVKFRHHIGKGESYASVEPYTWKAPPEDVQRRVALALFGDTAIDKVSAIRWTNTYLASDESFEWRQLNTQNTYQSGYSDPVAIPATEEPSKTHILVDFEYLRAQKNKPPQKQPQNVFDLLQEQERLRKEGKGK
ncbi:uncharacterized protein C8R40DRAFT_462600 [Lentinula edodes]|uniref:uncharacterized protein n=1 Tax=Lentinula edodes TaxID=5353 RepID=UPI001E8D00A6|nr:uncharacterized protein C8R40DRAFT_462600 [Lentinula edodes]KAH7880046.1 hypothetical protein C8R40DRAFT_462600 [Lentinula edodes]